MVDARCGGSRCAATLSQSGSTLDTVLIPAAMPDAPTPENQRAYWRANLRYVVALLAVWFAVSYGAGILFVEQLNALRIGTAPLGFWMAQQGSIYVFVALIFVYVWLMRRLDREYNVAE